MSIYVFIVLFVVKITINFKCFQIIIIMARIFVTFVSVCVEYNVQNIEGVAWFSAK